MSDAATTLLMTATTTTTFVNLTNTTAPVKKVTAPLFLISGIVTAVLATLLFIWIWMKMPRERRFDFPHMQRAGSDDGVVDPGNNAQARAFGLQAGMAVEDDAGRKPARGSADVDYSSNYVSFTDASSKPASDHARRELDIEGNKLVAM